MYHLKCGYLQLINNPIMFSQQEIDNYRAAVLAAMMAKEDADGQKIMEETEAKSLLQGFTDDELIDGMPFNTPEEMADMLLFD